MAWETVQKRYKEHGDENEVKGRKVNEIRCREDEKLIRAQRLDCRDANAV